MFLVWGFFLKEVLSSIEGHSGCFHVLAIGQLYDFIHMWDIKLKGTNQTKKELIDTHNRMMVTRMEENVGENEEDKGDHICDGRGWWAHSRLYRYIIKLYTWNLYKCY